MAGDFVASAVKFDDFIGADPVPMAGPLIDQTARDIERRPRFVGIENFATDRGRALRRVVERES